MGSDAFVLSQYRYYRDHSGIQGNGQNQVLGTYQWYLGEALKRGLVKRDPISNCYYEVEAKNGT